VLGQGKKLNLDEKIVEKEGDEMGSMLEGLIAGTTSAEDFDKAINNMVEDVNASGVLPGGIDPNDPESMRKNTQTNEEELESPEAGKGLEAQLMAEVAGVLVKGMMAQLVVEGQSQENFMTLLEKATKENPALSLAMLSGVVNGMNEAQTNLLKP
jgi:hypothetical protein